MSMTPGTARKRQLDRPKSSGSATAPATSAGPNKAPRSTELAELLNKKDSGIPLNRAERRLLARLEGRA